MTGRQDDSGQDTSRLAERLIALGYIELFLRQGEDAIDEIWNQLGSDELLQSLAVATDAPAGARFLAAEILSRKLARYPTEELKIQLAPTYAEALACDYTQMANPWGMPGNLDGLAGQHIVALGEAAVPNLVKLLDDETRMLYSGSQEATVGNSYEYRVKDLAAFFICQIRKLPFEVNPSPEARDKEIEQLKNSLK